MATLTRQQIVTAGLLATYSACAGGGDAFDNTDGKTLLHVKNGSGASITVTVAAQNTSVVVNNYGTLTVASIAVAISAGTEKIIGPFPTTAYNNSTNQIVVTYSGVTTLTIAGLFVDKQPL